MSLEIRAMAAADHPALIALWRASEGVTIRDADSPAGLAVYLGRNPGLSLVALEAGMLVGAAMVGHDGRRGILHHVAVAASHRRRGIGRMLVERALDGLRRAGIGKCLLLLQAGNTAGRAFWKSMGWEERGDVAMMSIVISDSENA